MSQTFEPQILNHPLIQHKISLMRKKETGSKDFRELASEVATLMCYEATRDLPLKEVTVETPICRCKTKMIAGRKLAIVPILRAGLGMVDGMLTLIPAAKVGHIGLYRDEETAKPIEYFCKLPCDISEREVIVVDPMLVQAKQMADDFARRIMQQGMSVEQYFQFTGLNEEKMMEELKPQAEKRIRTRLVLEAIVAAENIEVSDERLDEELQKMADSYQMKVEKLKEFMGENEKKQMKEDIAVQDAVTLITEAAVEE